MVKDSGKVVEIKSFAKVNLFLDVFGKREDGYHEISSIMQTISLHDTLIFEKTESGFQLESTVNIPGKSSIEKAYEIFKGEVGLDFGIKVKLIKRIPMMSGLGGGSSNAAATLKYLALQTRTNENDVLELAAKVGSDVPFFTKCGTAFVEGRGEILHWLDDLPSYGVDIAIPGVRISTKQAYSWLESWDYGNAECSAMDLYEAYKFKEERRISECSYNVFQEAILEKFWEIKKALEYLKEKDPIVSMMTGSGSAVFAVFPKNFGIFSFVNSACEIPSANKPM